jgi:hypothetical protein
MSSTVSPAAWLQTALARPLHAAATTPPGGGRHRAPEEPDRVELLTSEQIAAGAGRHADSERARDLFDPARDEGDAFDWLGFEAV